MNNQKGYLKQALDCHALRYFRLQQKQTDGMG
jgi:hypothetical protein